MPQALPALGAIVVGAFSSGAAAAMGASVIGTMALGAIGGAIVGAAIGGLTAAISGGDIGKGLLFGAIGGAVGGALTGVLGGPLQGVGTDLAGQTSSIVQGGVNATYDSVTGEVFSMGAAEAVKEGGIGVAMGGLGDISAGAGMLGKAGLDMISAGLAEDPDTPYNQTKDFYEDAQAHDKEMANLAASLRSSSGGGGSKLPWSSSEAGIKYQKGMDYKMNTENNAARMSELQKQYALQKEQTSHEWKLGRQVFDDAATAASSGQYNSGRDQIGQQVVNKQKAEAGALQGLQPQETANTA